MHITILTISSKAFWSLARLTNLNKLAYCNEWCHTLEAKHVEMHPWFWGERQEHQIHALRHCDWLWFQGIDTLITKFDTDISSLCDPNYEFIIAKDHVPGRTPEDYINNDSFLIKNCQASFQFLETVFSMRKARGVVCDQQAMGILLDQGFPIKVKYEQQYLINGYVNKLYGREETKEKGNWTENESFLVHFPGVEYQARIDLVKRFLGIPPLPEKLVATDQEQHTSTT